MLTLLDVLLQYPLDRTGTSSAGHHHIKVVERLRGIRGLSLSSGLRDLVGSGGNSITGDTSLFRKLWMSDGRREESNEASAQMDSMMTGCASLPKLLLR